MVEIFSTCARFLNDFGALRLHSEPPPPSPGAELGRHGPGWASKDRQTGWLTGQLVGSWLAGWLASRLAGGLALECGVLWIVGCVIVRVRVCTRRMRACPHAPRTHEL